MYRVEFSQGLETNSKVTFSCQENSSNKRNSFKKLGHPALKSATLLQGGSSLFDICFMPSDTSESEAADCAYLLQLN